MRNNSHVLTDLDEHTLRYREDEILTKQFCCVFVYSLSFLVCLHSILTIICCELCTYFDEQMRGDSNTILFLYTKF